MSTVKSHSALRAPPFPGRLERRWGYGLAGTCGLGLLLMSQVATAALSITSASWSNGRLTVSGAGDRGDRVTVVNADGTSQTLGSTRVGRGGSWSLSVTNPNPVPCSVTASAPAEQPVTSLVDNAPASCVQPCEPANLDVSINSTSQNGCPSASLTPQDAVPNTSYSVLAINDLGMHCGDLDTRVASILPPFQVLLAQIVKKGATPTLNPRDANGNLLLSVAYSAAANGSDPILDSAVFDGVMPGSGDTYKTNFWDIALQAYDPFYPAGVLADYYDPDPAKNLDIGLPVPNVEDLYIGPDGVVDQGCDQPDADCDGSLHAVQHTMPGIADPYVANAPQPVKEHYDDKPFFVNFPFGYVAAGVDWYEGAGIPLAAFDDNGRENAYPLVRVQAKDAQGNVLSTVDTVLPISGEASCTNCHTTANDYASVQGSTDGHRSEQPISELGGLPVATTASDPALGDLPPRVSLEYAADINILRLHDKKHGARYVSTDCDAPGQNCLQTAAAPCDITKNGGYGDDTCLTNRALLQDKPVVCQVCHYTPALDLAQVGPKAGVEGNGRNQLAHKSNSNVMHSHHGQYTALFPAIPAPIQDSDQASPTYGAMVNQDARLSSLENSCYQCHPGKNTQCLRGAMFNGDMLCSDCHGGMDQVGDDFSAGVDPEHPGAFVLDQGDFYDPNSTQPRVPWANEPGCGSCHTGDTNGNLAKVDGALVNVADTEGNTDGIRLRQAFKTGDSKATPIVPTNKRFAEPAVPESFNGFANPGAGNPQLYRVSTGHGGVMCEGCHGATHAEWPNARESANDNIAADQLQAHTGAIIECGTCHTNVDGLSPNGSLSSLRGPHGLHAVGNTNFARSRHKENWSNASRAECRACHGQDGEGTVLSRMATDRYLQCKDEKGDVCNSSGTTLFAKGHMVGCNDCHENMINK